MPTIVELIEDAAVGAGRLRFCSAAVDSDVTTAELWHASERAAAWLRAFAGTAEPVALVLTASLPCLATLIGGWRGGHLVASLPLPARGMDATEYRQQIASQLATVAARVVVCDPRHYPLLEGIADEVRVFDEYDSTAPTRPLTGDGTFVQFTSGATGAPKGVRLSLHAIGNNVTAIADALEVSRGDVWCSWLPLSHDMGLMGACLTSIVSSAPRIAGSQGLVQLQPETFLADPSAWLATCADVHAAVTIVPSFALALAMRVSSRFSGRNLRSLRVCAIGAERVHPATLRSFTATFQRHGLAPAAVCPAYGLAEATLAVAVTRPDDVWRSVWLDIPALERQRWVEASAGDALEFVSCGIALRGVDLRAPSGGDELGELEIRGPSLMEGYLGAEAPWTSDGYLRTHDLARLDGSELFIIGRTDDTISASGRNVYAPRLEEALWQLPELRAGCVVLVSLADGRYACVAEAKEPGDVDITQTGRRIRSLLARMSGLSPSVIAFVERGSLPKTPSGKIQRIRTATLFEAEQLPVFALQTFGA